MRLAENQLCNTLGRFFYRIKWHFKRAARDRERDKEESSRREAGGYGRAERLALTGPKRKKEQKFAGRL